MGKHNNHHNQKIVAVLLDGKRVKMNRIKYFQHIIRKSKGCSEYKEIKICKD